MYWCKRYCYLTALIAIMSSDVMAAGYALGLGAESDTAGGRAVSAFGDVGLGDNTWISAAAATTRTGGDLNLDTVYFDIGIDHSFNPVGIRLAASYWGDDEILDSVDLRASLYVRGEPGYLSADYERREFNFTFQALSNPRQIRTTQFSSDGFGLTGRIKASERINLFAGAMSYQYSRDLRLQPDIDVLIDFSSSRLSLMNSLLDYRTYAGIEWRFGLASVDLRAEQWQTAIDGSKVNSIGLGLLTPVSDRGDMEYRFMFDDSDRYGQTVSFAVYYYYFGG
jgi:hypothetical protein